MEINISATKHNMRLLKLESWAREKGLRGSTVRRILWDPSYPQGGPEFMKFVEAARQDGYLVEEPGGKDAA